MKKYITIKNCTECPFIEVENKRVELINGKMADILKYMCRDNDWVEILDPESFPDFCKLKDKEDD